MKKNFMNIFSAVLAVFALLVASGCERRPLEDVETVGIIIRVDWKYYEMETEKPTGMTMVFQDQFGLVTRVTTSSVDSIYVTLPVGTYDAFVFNQSEQEFSSYSFSGMDSYPDATAELKSFRSRWYSAQRSETDDEPVATTPEQLGVGLGHFSITQDMVDAYNRYYPHNKKNKATKDHPAEVDRSASVLLTIYPVDVVSVVQVKCYIKNIDKLYSARASLSGMARRYRMTKEVTGPETITQLLEHWRAVRNVDDKTLGYIYAVSDIYSLGLSNGDDTQSKINLRDTLDNKFELNLLLVDGKTQMRFPFWVGSRFTIKKDYADDINIRDTLFLELGKNGEIELPDVIVDSTANGGFSANVEDWDDQVNVNIPI